MPALDVIIVSHNSGDLLLACLRAVLASTVSVRVVVVDNASTDGSVTRLKEEASRDPRIFVLFNEINRGFSSASNRGLTATSADFILFLNPDCLVSVDTLERMQAALAERPEFGMAGCLIRNFDGSEQIGCRRTIPNLSTAMARVLHWRPSYFDQVGTALPSGPVPVEAISGAFMLVRRSALDKVGPLDDGYFLHCEDLDWCARFKQLGLPILFVPDVEVRHAKGSSSVERWAFVERHKHAGMLRFYRKFLRDAYPEPLWWLVWIAVWIRFALKTLWVAACRLRGKMNV